MSSPARIIEWDSLAKGGESYEQPLPPPILPVSETTMVEVIAPSTLDEGYTFDAVHERRVFPVTVPKGGVRAGDSFLVPFVPYDDQDLIVAEAVLVSNETTPMLPPTAVTQTNYAINCTASAPLGVWRDGLCDCCSQGCCHPSLLNALCFKQILMGQVLTRMRLTWCGDQTKSRVGYKQTFHVLLWLTISYWICWLFFHHCSGNNHGWACNGHRRRFSIMGMVNCVWFVYTVLVMTKLRKAVRDRYKIPQKQCVGCEDCCCALFCSCCTVAQLARQTADYRRQRAYCCTDSGIGDEPCTIDNALVV